MNNAAHIHHAREGIGEVHHEDGANEGNDAVQVGDGARNDKGQDPVAGSQEVPEDLALLFGDWREFENGLEDFEIDGLHADVEVHDDGDPARQ